MKKPVLTSHLRALSYKPFVYFNFPLHNTD